MGLGHPFHPSFHNGWKGHRPREDPSTVMSYWDGRNGYIDGALSPNDIKALQFLYGKPGTNFDGVESRMITPFNVFDINPDRNAVFIDEETIATGQELARFKISNKSFGNDRLIITSTNADMVELRYNSNDDSVSLLLKSGTTFDFETFGPNQGPRHLIRLGLAEPDNKILLKPIYFMLNIRDVDEKPTEMVVSPERVSHLADELTLFLSENQPTTAKKLASITFTDDAKGTNRPTLTTNPRNLFELKQSDAGNWELWLRAEVTLDFESLRKEGETDETTIEAVIGSETSGIGDEPVSESYGVTLYNNLEFSPDNTFSMSNDNNRGDEFKAHVGDTLRANVSNITSDDGELSFTYLWERDIPWDRHHELVSEEDHFTPTVTGIYYLRVTATAGPHTKVYVKNFRVYRAEPESAGSQSEMFQAPLDDPLDTLLNDSPPLQLDAL